jgi:hypothetical protein
MRSASLRTLALGMVLKLVLGRLERDEAPVRRPRRRRGGARSSEGARAPEAPAEHGTRPKPLLGLMLGALVVGVPLMVLFEGALTRILGLLCLFTFIITGVFLIAHPSALGRAED